VDPPIRAREPAALPPFRAPYRPAVLGAATPAFLRIYDRYPKKIGKQPAAQVFQELAADYPGGQEALSAAILAAFDAGMLARHPYSGEDSKRPALERVLAERRWEDDQSAPDEAPARAAVSNPYRPIPRLGPGVPPPPRPRP
jgi:hypothetical protein